MIYSKGTEYIASFSEYVFKAYSAGDTVAEKILDKNFSKIADLINHAYKEYGCGGKVIISGGITKNSEIMEKFLKNKVNSELNPIFPDMPQVYGACRKCCSAFSQLEDGFEENFRADYLNKELN